MTGLCSAGVSRYGSPVRGLWLFAPVIVALGCTPRPASLRDDVKTGLAPAVPEMNAGLREVYELRLVGQLGRAAELATHGAQGARRDGQGHLAARFDCAHALLSAELDRSIDVARRELGAAVSALKDAVPWMRAECALADLTISAIEFDFARASEAAAQAYQLTRDTPHPSHERAAAILCGHAMMVARRDPPAGIDLVAEAIEIEREPGGPACPNLAVTMLVAGGMDYVAERYDDARANAKFIEENCTSDATRLILARGRELGAAVDMAEGRSAGAVSVLERELPLIKERGTPGDRARFALTLAFLYEDQGRVEDARAVLQERIDAAVGPKQPQLARRIRMSTMLLMTEARTENWAAVVEIAPGLEQDLDASDMPADDTGRWLVAHHKCRALLYSEGEGAGVACSGRLPELERDDVEAAKLLRALGEP